MRISLCQHCGRRFKPRRGKRYCSDMCRYEAWKATASPCYYCGCPAETVDHVPPRSVRPILIQMGVTRWDFIEVEACKECNCVLGHKSLWTLTERKAYIKQWLRRRYRRYISMPAWTDAELDELGRGIQQYVDQGRIIGELARKRIAW